MKYPLFLSLVFLSFIGLGQSKDAALIIGSPIKIGKLLVAENDFPRKMDWPEAINSCNELGIGWRLPSKKELNIMYLNRSKIGRFVEDNYWSMDMVTVRPGNFIYFHVWYQSFDNTGEINTTDKQEELNVRAVKTL